MKNQIINFTKEGMLLGLAAVMTLCMGQSSASAKPSHGGGSGGGSGGGAFYPTVSTVSQLIADINYANQTGGAVSINLASGTTFDLTSANNSTDGGNGLPVIGGNIPVDLTIIGNGDTIERIAVLTRLGAVKNPFNLFDVAAGSALTLEQITLKNGIPLTGPGGQSSTMARSKLLMAAPYPATRPPSTMVAGRQRSGTATFPTTGMASSTSAVP